VIETRERPKVQGRPDGNRWRKEMTTEAVVREEIAGTQTRKYGTWVFRFSRLWMWRLAMQSG